MAFFGDQKSRLFTRTFEKLSLQEPLIEFFVVSDSKCSNMYGVPKEKKESIVFFRKMDN